MVSFKLLITTCYYLLYCYKHSFILAINDERQQQQQQQHVTQQQQQHIAVLQQQQQQVQIQTIKDEKVSPSTFVTSIKQQPVVMQHVTASTASVTPTTAGGATITLTNGPLKTEPNKTMEIPDTKPIIRGGQVQPAGIEMYKVNIEDISQLFTYHEVFGKIHGDAMNHQLAALHSNTNAASSNVAVAAAVVAQANAAAAAAQQQTVLTTASPTSTTNMITPAASNTVVKTTSSSTTTTSSSPGGVTATLTGVTGELIMPKMEGGLPVVEQPTTISLAPDGTPIATGTHVCDICGKMFQFRYQLIVHRRYHSERKPFNCQVCGQGFQTSQDLTSHGKIHIGGPMFTCIVCFNVFANQASLERHMKRHSTDKPFACTICQKTFARKEHLDNHFRSHTGIIALLFLS